MDMDMDDVAEERIGFLARGMELEYDTKLLTKSQAHMILGLGYGLRRTTLGKMIGRGEIALVSRGRGEPLIETKELARYIVEMRPKFGFSKYCV